MTDIIQIQESEYDAILRQAVAVLKAKSNLICHRNAIQTAINAPFQPRKLNFKGKYVVV